MHIYHFFKQEVFLLTANQHHIIAGLLLYTELAKVEGGPQAPVSIIQAAIQPRNLLYIHQNVQLTVSTSQKRSLLVWRDFVAAGYLSEFSNITFC